MAINGVWENITRLATIIGVNYSKQSCIIRMFDRVETKEYEVPLPHPMTSTDSGFYAHPEKGTVVLVGWGYREKPYILSTTPNSAFAQDYTDANFTTDIPVNYTGYPFLRSGEMALAGKQGTQIKLSDVGSIECSFGSSKHILDFKDRHLLASNEKTEVLDSGYAVEGIVQRDLRILATSAEGSEDKLTSFSFARVMSEIGRDPLLGTVTLTNGLGSPTAVRRNPALTEQKRITYEFSRRDAVDHLDKEIDYQSHDQDHSFLVNTNDRKENRIDVLDLNVDNPNLLIEEVSGTLVDIYGNVLDINRNKINFPAKQPDPGNPSARLTFLNALLKRSVKYHKEINVKKEQYGQVAVDTLDGEFKNGHTHSRWSLDVDGEGFTKINIPASSNIGNIPFLARYVNSHLKNKTRSNSFKDETHTDIYHLAFGDLEAQGVAVPPEYAPKSLNNGAVKYRTAFHDIVKTATKILAADAIGTNLDNRVPTSGSSSGNAGGRSLHVNLDGSLELNVGRDVVDGKSIVLDTSGGIVSRIGKTKTTAHQASVISQLDGSVYIQVGGDNAEPDTTLQDPEVKLFVIGSQGTDEIHITKDFIKLKSAEKGKNIIIDSSKNIVLKARGTILLAGSTVAAHGTADDKGDSINPKRVILQDGKAL